MGKRDNKYKLHHQIELDEGFFEVVPNKEDREKITKEIADNQGKLKRGKGSQKQASIWVMIESKPVGPLNQESKAEVKAMRKFV